MNKSDVESYNSLCNKCDSGCCKLFIIPKSTKFPTKLSNKLSHLYSLIFIKLFMKNVSGNVEKIAELSKDAKFSKHVIKDFMNVNYQNLTANDKILTCKLVRNNLCSLYSIRPQFCRTYKCYNNEQIYHHYLKTKNLPIPSHLQHTTAMQIKQLDDYPQLKELKEKLTK
jgi:Fe-S-cluster containining protein